jgi:hypothetical protein
MKLKVKRGLTSKLLRLFLADTTATDGGGLTGLTNASAGLSAYYIREGDVTPTAIALVAGTVGTWVSGGFKEVDATNLPGLYELGVPDAAFASGQTVSLMVRGAASLAVNLTEIELDAIDYQDGNAAGLVNIGLIKAKTDALPSNPAASGDTMTIDPADPTLATIAGLLGQNQVFRDLVYDTNGLLQSGLIRIYDTAVNAGGDDGVTGLLHAYSLTNTISDATVAKQVTAQVS